MNEYSMHQTPPTVDRPYADLVASAAVVTILISFATRSRGDGTEGSFTAVLELLLLACAVGVIAKREWVLNASLFLLAIFLHKVLSVILLGHGLEDILSSRNAIFQLTRGVFLYIIINSIQERNRALAILISLAVVLVVYASRLGNVVYYGDDGSFHGGMSDRNYMAMFLAASLFCLVTIFRRNRIESRILHSALIAFHVAATILCVAAGSRSGILACVLSLLIYSPKFGLLTIVLTAPIVLSSEIAEYSLARFERMFAGEGDEWVRKAQNLAAMSALAENPYGFIWGLGVSATHNSEWFLTFYERLEGFQLYKSAEGEVIVFIVHNSFLDFFVSFGIIGTFLFAKWAWRHADFWTLSFAVIFGLFNNILLFLPTFLLLSTAASGRRLTSS